MVFATKTNCFWQPKTDGSWIPIDGFCDPINCCGNKNRLLWQQKPMVLATGTDGFGNKKLWFWQQRFMVFTTKTNGDCKKNWWCSQPKLMVRATKTDGFGNQSWLFFYKTDGVCNQHWFFCSQNWWFL